MINSRFDRELFRSLCKKERTNQRELAKLVKMKEKTFSLYLSDKLNDDVKEKIAEKLRTTVDKLWIPVVNNGGNDITKPANAPGTEDYKDRYIKLLEETRGLNLVEMAKAIEDGIILLREVYKEVLEHREYVESKQANKGKSAAE